MMAEPSPLPTREPSVLLPPDYAPGVKVETWQETSTHEVGMDVSLSLGRHVRITQEELLRHRDQHAVAQAAIERAVRQMQDEAVTALGLQHWRTEVEREVRETERRERRSLLRALATAVRNAPTTDAAALIVLDELEVMDQ